MNCVWILLVLINNDLLRTWRTPNEHLVLYTESPDIQLCDCTDIRNSQEERSAGGTAGVDTAGFLFGNNLALYRNKGFAQNQRAFRQHILDGAAVPVLLYRISLALGQKRAFRVGIVAFHADNDYIVWMSNVDIKTKLELNK